MATFPLGVTYEIDPLPLVEDDTTFFPAGVVTIGVEFRRVDMETLKAGFGEELVAAENRILDDAGVSLHVVGAQDNKEYLRFDCFTKDAHYHYINWGVRQTIVPFDLVASGDMLTWALDAIGHRLDDMLSFAGADDLAGAVDMAVVRKTLAEVAPVARAAQLALGDAIA
ncbi:hypothetical protein A5719_11035 [Mycolicibacterium peregrinum]|uniref:DUF7700 domain-containing protein n=1 Tax=Mycolicibacterium peregrinum TaxID=43304 RepID=UPI0007EAFB63|nr:hypothetical protein [Mycolicibacterium peregrinum]OBF41907.1 hypothetical protein A5719_11035 [Mycolicibacterium peregrinum]